MTHTEPRLKFVTKREGGLEAKLPTEGVGGRGGLISRPFLCIKACHTCSERVICWYLTCEGYSCHT